MAISVGEGSDGQFMGGESVNINYVYRTRFEKLFYRIFGDYYARRC